jgi:hypothetical protein
MPNRQGQSKEETKQKSETLRYFYATEARIALNIGRTFYDRYGKRFSYWVIDCNSGSGYNSDCGGPPIEGSPLVARKQFAKLTECWNVCYRLCDIDRPAIDKLKSNLGPMNDGENVKFYRGDNEKFLDKRLIEIGETERLSQAMGVITVDPNQAWYKNEKGEGPPGNLSYFLECCPKFDVFLHLNKDAHFRQMGTNFERFGWKGCRPQPMQEMINEMNKRYWLVKITRRWVYWIGSNLPFAQKNSGFVSLESEKGCEIMDDFNEREGDQT